MTTTAEEYLFLIKKLDELYEAGKDDDKEADDLRDYMDKVWYNLSIEEREKYHARVADLKTRK